MLQSALQDSTAIEDYLEFSNSFYQDLLGYKPEQTSLQTLTQEQWRPFSERIGLNSNSSGIYLPRNQMAIIQEENPLSLFHEYFGHGLFCEQSLIGRKLVDLEKALLEEERQEFQGRQFTLEDVQKFRNKNQMFQELEEHRKQNLGIYEGFAIWTEHLLSGEFGISDEFEGRYNSFSRKERELTDSVINFSKKYGDLAVFYAWGMKKVQDKKRLLRLSQDLFKDKLDRTRLVLHFGSGKEFSDIDLFIVSNEISPSYDYWLDIRASRIGEVEEGIKVLNPMVTDPVMVGRTIFGDGRYLDELKRKILAQPITDEAIRFSLQEYESEKKRSQDKSLGKHLQEKNLRSAKTFLTNALALKNGDKVFTFNGLVDYARERLSHSEKFIELKGGIE